MALQRTITHPPQDFSQVMDQPAIKLIVLGNHNDLVAKADQLATSVIAGIERQVIWLPAGQVPATLAAKVDGLDQVNSAQFKAVAISTKNKIADKIPIGDPDDYVRIDHAFTKAGLPEFN